jgi:hypothetical protein
MKVQHEHRNTYDETFPYTIYGTYFKHNYGVDTRNRILNDLTRRQKQTELKNELTS